LPELDGRAIEPRGGNALRRYETIFITLADMSADETGELIERYKTIITSLEGRMLKIESWGKRKLAYPIEKRKEGFYVLFDFAGESAAVMEMERNFRIDDRIMRFQTVKIADSISPEEIEEELAEAKKKEEAEAKRRAEAETRRQEAAEAAAAAAAAVPAPEETPEEKPVEEAAEEAAVAPPPEEKPVEKSVEETEAVEEGSVEEEKEEPETELAETEGEEEKKKEGEE
jgi:small subunit ribosomal protein S6